MTDGIQLPPPPIVVLTITADGTKLRGSDQKPLKELSAEELLAVIDELIALIGGMR